MKKKHTMLENEKHLSTQLTDWKEKIKILRYENLLLIRERRRPEANLTLATID